MSKILVLLVGVAMTWGLVTTFGLISMAICFALALGSLIFSTESEEHKVAKVADASSRKLFRSAST